MQIGYLIGQPVVTMTTSRNHDNQVINRVTNTLNYTSNNANNEKCLDSEKFQHLVKTKKYPTITHNEKYLDN
jgi:hypothetical protein